MNKLVAVAGAAALGLSVAACGGSPAPAVKPGVSSCTKAYPAWFKASAAAGKTTATPAACAGLTQDQITAISLKYLGGN